MSRVSDLGRINQAGRLKLISIKLISPETSSDPVESLVSTMSTWGITSAPDYDRVTLVSSTGTSFITSRKLLTHHSSFFASLLSIPEPALDADARSEPLILPSASSQGLALILAILESVGTTSDKKLPSSAYKYWMGISEEDLAVIAEAAICADAYDIPTFDKAFILPILARMKHQPLIAFAVAAITNHTSLLPTLAKQTVEDCATFRSNLPSSISFVLNRYAPQAKSRLTALYLRADSSQRELKRELLYNARIPNENQGFSKRCEGKCSAYESQNSWKKLRTDAGKAVYDDMMEDPDEATDTFFGIRSVVMRNVSCRICATRLTRAFEGPVADFVAVSGGY